MDLKGLLDRKEKKKDFGIAELINIAFNYVIPAIPALVNAFKDNQRVFLFP